MKDNYLTIKQSAQGLYRDRGSKFLSFAFPVNSEDEIKGILDKIRKDYHDARHHCYAWRLGHEKESFRSNDDGEPSGTAGRPILGQIQKHDLTFILIVVVRYFGGVLLGSGGLINAYRSAAADAIASAGIISKTITEIFEVRFPYSAMNAVMTVLKEEQAVQLNHEFGLTCKIEVSVQRGLSGRLTSRLGNIENTEVVKL
jgi:uncharacterized YigZ family protein